MDKEYEKLAKHILEAGENNGFVLAGGQALVAHELSGRPSKDIDIFTNNTDPKVFRKSIDEITNHLNSLGYSSRINKLYDSYAQIDFTSPNGDELGADLGVDIRNYPPAQMKFGPTLDVRDAIGNKINALYARSLARDSVDLYSLLKNTDLSIDSLVTYANESVHNKLDYYHLAGAINNHHSHAKEEYLELGLKEEDLAHFHQTLDDTADYLQKKATQNSSRLEDPSTDYTPPDGSGPGGNGPHLN